MEDILKQTKDVYDVVGSRGVCGFVTQIYSEDYKAIEMKALAGDPEYKTLYAIVQLNKLHISHSVRQSTPLQLARQLLDLLQQRMVWPLRPNQEHQYLNESTLYALELVMRKFYDHHTQLGPKARFGTTTVSVLRMLRDSIERVKEAKAISDTLTQFMLVNKLSR